MLTWLKNMKDSKTKQKLDGILKRLPALAIGPLYKYKYDEVFNCLSNRYKKILSSHIDRVKEKNFIAFAKLLSMVGGLALASKQASRDIHSKISCYYFVETKDGIPTEICMYLKNKESNSILLTLHFNKVLEQQTSNNNHYTITLPYTNCHGFTIHTTWVISSFAWSYPLSQYSSEKILEIIDNSYEVFKVQFMCAPVLEQEINKSIENLSPMDAMCTREKGLVTYLRKGN